MKVLQIWVLQRATCWCDKVITGQIVPNSCSTPRFTDHLSVCCHQRGAVQHSLILFTSV